MAEQKQQTQEQPRADLTRTQASYDKSAEQSQPAPQPQARFTDWASI